MSKCTFTYSHYAEIFRTAILEDYQIITLADWFQGRYDSNRKVLVNRIDVDDNIQRLWPMADIFRKLGIRTSIFLRLHARGYNLLFHDNISLVRRLLADGHEVGLHAEIVDVQHICGLDPTLTLRAEVTLFRDLLGANPQGVASHGDMTPYNNLDFWKDHVPSEFGLLYEAYDQPLWGNSRYVSDSEYTRWKAYEDGVLRKEDRRCACEHIRDGVAVLYLLTHTCSWYAMHIHEQTPRTPTVPL